MTKKKKRKNKPGSITDPETAIINRLSPEKQTLSNNPVKEVDAGAVQESPRLGHYAKTIYRYCSRQWVILPLLVIFLFCVHWPALNASYFLDDYKYIEGNERIHDLSLLFSRMPDWLHQRGIVQLSFAIDIILYGGSQIGMHFSSILYHILASLLVWKLWIELYRCFHTDRDYRVLSVFAGLAAVLFFAVHPLVTQPICHLVSRADILAAIFYLLGSIVSLMVSRTKILTAETIGKTLVFIFVQFCLVSFFCFFGVAAKEIIVTLPFMVIIANALALRNHPFKRQIICALFFILPYILLTAGYLLYRKSLYGDYLGFSDALFRPYTVNAMTQAVVIVFYYLPRVFFPIHLYYDPYFPEYASLWNIQVLISAAILVVLFTVAFLLRRRSPMTAFGILWFFITISPTSSFIPLIDLVAERRIYLSLIGVGFIAAAGFQQWFDRSHIIKKRAVGVILALVTAFFSVMAYHRDTDYTNYFTLAVNDIEQQVQYGEIKPRTVNFLIGGALQDDKIDRAYNYLQEKKFNYDRLVEFLLSNGPADYQAFDNFIKFLTFSGKQTESLKRFIDHFFKYNMDNVTLLINLQNLFLMSGDYAEAERIIDYTLKLDPTNLDTLLNKANIYKTRNDTENILKYIKMALDLYPNSKLPLQHMIDFFEVNGLDATQLKQRLQEIKDDELRLTKTLKNDRS